MSKISQSLTIIKSTVATLLTNHVALSNPYETDECTEPELKLGYGIIIGPASNSERQICGKLSVKREIGIVITRKYYANELDIEAKEDAHKLILEDMYLVIKNFEADPTLALSAGGTSTFKYIGDNGLDTIFDDKDSFFKIELSYTLEYFENLT